MKQQNFSSDSLAVECLVVLAALHSIAVSPENIDHRFRASTGAFGMTELLLAAKEVGLKAKAVIATADRLRLTPLPAIALGKDGRFFVMARYDGGRALIHDPSVGRPQWLDAEQLAERWTGDLVLTRAKLLRGGEIAKFDFTWFIPAVVKYRKLLGEVFVASFALQVVALLTPIFFQVIMDKVIVHGSLTTLDTLAIGLLAIGFFEIFLSYLRGYIFTHTTSRIDVELSARLFNHLIRLPIAYFQSRRVGDSVARVKELENIRAFLTGNVITVILDCFFSIVFIAVMLFYSKVLTLIVVLSLPAYAAISMLITPPLRRRLDEVFSRGAENQAFLVESVTGIETIKAMAVEPHVNRRWEEQTAGYVRANFMTQRLSLFANEAVSLVGKVVMVLTLWFGARLVISGDLSVGELIAFNMLASRVAQPIMRLAQLWINFQQTGVSMQRLGDVLNSPTEATGVSRSVMPPIRGDIQFENVTFRYRVDGPEVLRDIHLDIRAGQVIGFVGRSGSGKSTTAHLIQRMHVPERGRILIDGMDVALADASSLRRQIGVVQQENVLFHRSIRDNIAFSEPGAPIEQVIQAATIAGAHDFILELPEGYDTLVGERGASLSGGQRQRIAIARALMGNPRILIFDEATSALDYESEHIIRNNMSAICRGRTVIIIAHRLSAVYDADEIIVMDRGNIVERGNHRDLVNRPNGHYARLHGIQASARG
ncbi:type I secretion system permease/ATPase [Aureimonas fodinaquatilis]|uniref:Type I secretion system permease/ATPase n=1 Tax=Aureimonas fodinaquatilis TaxID=2565783 RepID=A0A5B0E288_9HYPH|nr:type I secretion system permease/ATPase [Aureimonas fodinaquatilis]KAA0972235.1 type I secretion system permease/ATPase [Aureimonas fodinaquatilis]